MKEITIHDSGFITVTINAQQEDGSTLTVTHKGVDAFDVYAKLIAPYERGMLVDDYARSCAAVFEQLGWGKMTIDAAAKLSYALQSHVNEVKKNDPLNPPVATPSSTASPSGSSTE